MRHDRRSLSSVPDRWGRSQLSTRRPGVIKWMCTSFEEVGEHFISSQELYIVKLFCLDLCGNDIDLQPHSLGACCRSVPCPFICILLRPQQYYIEARKPQAGESYLTSIYTHGNLPRSSRRDKCTIEFHEVHQSRTVRARHSGHALFFPSRPNLVHPLVHNTYAWPYGAQ